MAAILKGKHLTQSALVLAVLVTLGLGAFIVMPSRSALADTGNNYPWSGATHVGFSEWGYRKCPSNAPSCMALTQVYNGVTYGLADAWGYVFRNCTSWAAWAVHDRDGVDVPRGLGNADTWASHASADGIKVDTTPAAGAIAQWNDARWNYNFGHVAWIETVNSSTSITIEEYNAQVDKNGNPTGTWSTATLTKGGSKPVPWPDNIIHFGTVRLLTPSSPSAVSRTASTMDVFYTLNGNLVDVYWDASIGWNKQSWNLGAVGKPAAISRNGGNDLWVFYRTTSGGIGNISWNYQTGWTNGPMIASSGVTSDPAASVRDSSHVEVTWQGSDGALMHRSWDYGAGGWLSIDTLMPDSVTGAPAIVDRNSSAIDIFVLKNNGNLVNEFWDYPNPWNRQDWTSSMIGNPAVVSTSSDNMDVFYRKNIGFLEHRYWTSETGWQYEDWAAQMTIDPSVVNNGNDLYVFYVETGGNVKESFRLSGTWASSNAANSGANGSFSPSAIVRANGMEVFYWGKDGTLKDARGDFTGYDWSISTISNTP